MVVPRSQQEWDRWSYHHRGDHAEIIAAIQAQKNIELFSYPVDPIPFNHLPQWLEANAQMHQDFNTTLGLQASDLDAMDPKEPDLLKNWIYLHWLEHSSARQALGI